MAIRTIDYLKEKFTNGLKPPQEDFWDWLDSFFHKTDVTPPPPLQLYFSMAGDELTVTFEETFNVSSIVLGNAVSVQYSINNGGSWTTYTSGAIVLNAGTVRWRVTAFNTGFYDGNIIIKGS